LHAVNDASAQQIINKLDKKFKGSKHPYFNRKPVATEHGVQVDGETLFKLGQIDVDEYDKWLNEKAELSKIAGREVRPDYSRGKLQRAKKKAE